MILDLIVAMILHRSQQVSRSEQRQPLWDRVAHCESRNRWHINTGNGYSGGLQFSPTTWRAFGGRRFAPEAYLATKRQQIHIADRVLRVQGWRAWPVCGVK